MGIPQMSCSVYKEGLAGGQESFLFFSLFFWEFELFNEFGLFSIGLVSYVKFASLVKSAKFVSSGKPVGSRITAQGLSKQLVMRW